MAQESPVTPDKIIKALEYSDRLKDISESQQPCATHEIKLRGTNFVTPTFFQALEKYEIYCRGVVCLENSIRILVTDSR